MPLTGTSVVGGLQRLVVRAWNGVLSWNRPMPETDSEAYAEILRRSRRHTDISDHLPALFLESLLTEPSLIVEMGVRNGESTFVFERVSRIFGSVLVSVDLEDCSGVSEYERWHFVQQDDVEFGREFPTWCASHDLKPEIDVLFVDTSHLFEHTMEELDVWFPYLADGGVALLHDTNLTPWYRRNDDSIGRGWDNERGVIRALEEHLGLKFDETTTFRTVAGRFLVDHRPECNGLTVLRRMATESARRIPTQS